MITKITGEQPFQVLTNNFSISPSNEGYTLQISADGENYSNLFQVGANVTRLVTGVAANSYYRLLGNQSQVSINWMKTCVTGGEGGAGNELTPVTEFPLGAAAGTVVALASGDTYGIYQYDGTDWNPAGGDVDLSAYWTSAQTQSAITAVEDHLFDVEEVTASALTELHDDVLELSASTAGKADAANISGKSTGYYFPYYNEQGVITGDTQVYKATLNINLSDGSTSSSDIFKENNYGMPRIYVASKPGTAGQIAKSDGHGFTWADDIYTPTSGFSTINGSAITNGGNIVIQGGGGDMSGYWNSAETKTYVDSAVTSVQDQVDTLDEVASRALVDLNGRVDEISGATQDMVTSTDIKHIVKCTQAEYDDPSFIWDPETLYIIVNNSN